MSEEAEAGEVGQDDNRDPRRHGPTPQPAQPLMLPLPLFPFLPGAEELTADSPSTSPGTHAESVQSISKSALPWPHALLCTLLRCFGLLVLVFNWSLACHAYLMYSSPQQLIST